MDPILHILWTGLVFSQSNTILLAIVAGLLPDIISFLPFVVLNWLGGRKTKIEDYHPSMPRWMKTYRAYAFHITHSLVISSVAATTWYLLTGQWWLYGWTLHVALDIVSHRGDIATPFLYPFSEYKFHGFLWTDKKFIISNYVLIGIITILWWI